MRSAARGALAFLLLVGIAAGTASAASPEGDTPRSLFDAKYIVALGGYFPHVDSTLTLSGPGGGGTGLDSDRDLGMDDKAATVWGSFNWRFLPRHQLHLEYFQLNRDGSSTAGRNFNIGGTDVGLGASLDSKMDLGLGRITYAYSIIRKAKWGLTFNVGAHIATAKATITAAGNISENGMSVAGGSRTRSSSTLTFPLPHIGGTLAYQFGPKITGTLTALVFTLDLGDYGGTLVEADAMVSYQLSRHFGIGGGLKYFNLDLRDSLSGGGSAEFNYTFFGPGIFGYASF